MHARDHHGLRGYLRGSRHDSYRLAAIAALPARLSVLLGWRRLAVFPVPSVPIARVGTVPDIPV
jgi:hypothetical protein